MAPHPVGATRKSHTKSRKGCRTCKRRHIRCDETFPQCTNCTKHNCRCDYQDNPPSDAPPSPEAPNLLWTPRIELEIRQWQTTGVSPFPEMNLQSFSFQRLRGFPANDLRLIHHISNTYRDMRLANFVECIPWVEQIPNFFDAAVGFDFVMSAVLALSATHLAWITKSAATKNLAFYHGAVALTGLKAAMDNFSQDNSDAILAASILLSWQATDWESWVSHRNGISSVINSMGPWKDVSRFASYIDSNHSFFSPRFSYDDETLLAIHSLQGLSARMLDVHPMAKTLREILNWAMRFRSCSASMHDKQVFEELQPLRQWLFFMPVNLVKANDMGISAMILLAQLYALALAIDSSIPELKGAALGSLTVRAVEQIDNRLRHKQAHSYGVEMNPAEMDDLMQFARHTVASQSVSAAQIKLEDVGARSPGISNLPPHSPYSFRPASIGSQPGTPDHTLQSFTPPTLASHSFEDLSHPPSPFLHYPSQFSPQHSQVAESSSRPHSLSFESPYLPGYEHSLRGDSPAYSPAGYSPGFTPDQDEEAWGGPSPAYSQGAFVHPAIWT